MENFTAPPYNPDETYLVTSKSLGFVEQAENLEGMYRNIQNNPAHNPVLEQTFTVRQPDGVKLSLDKIMLQNCFDAKLMSEDELITIAKVED